MAFFKRGTKKDPVDLAQLLLEGSDMIEQVGAAHQSRWGLGKADRWNLDQMTGKITWTFPDRTAEAPAQILGSHNPTAGTWLWAWANEGILPGVSRDSERVREWAIENQVEAFQLAKVDADEEQAATLVSIAMRVTRASGLYRGPGGASAVFITFGPVTITDSSGESETFTIKVS